MISQPVKFIILGQHPAGYIFSEAIFKKVNWMKEVKLGRMLIQRYLKWFLVIWLYTGMLCIIAFYNAAGESSAGISVKNILVINSYHFGYKWSDDIMKAINTKMHELLPSAKLYYEFLDTKNFPSETHLGNVFDAIQKKFRKVAIDLVITTDNSAFNFMIKKRSQLFPIAPMVFCGVNFYEPKMIAGQKNITGVAETPDLKENCDTILNLHPTAKSIVFITDSKTASGKFNLDQLKSIKPQLESRVKVIIWNATTFSEILERVQNLESDAVVFPIGSSHDSDGTLVDGVEQGRRLSRASLAPIYSMWDFHLSTGIVGGYMIKASEQGNAAAELAARVLKGQPADEIPVVTDTTSSYYFDYQQLKRFGILTNSLPQGSHVINRPVSLYEQHKTFVWMAATSISVLTLLVFMLSFNIKMRGKAEKALREHRDTLEDRVNERTHELQKSEDRFRFLINSIPHMVWSAQPNGTIDYCNLRACDYLKSTPDPIACWAWVDTACSEDRRKMRSDWNHAIRSGREYCSEVRLKNGDTGEYRWFLFHTVPQYGQKGQVIRWYGTLTDINAIKQAEQKIRENENRLRMVLENSQDGIHQLDIRTGRFVFMSPSQAKLTGFTKAEHMVPANKSADRLHPDDRETVNKYLARIIAGEEAEYPMEYRWQVKTGKFRWFSDSRKAVLDDNGNVIAIVGVTRDITELKQVQKALENSKSELETQVAQRTALANARSNQLQALAVELIEAEERERQRIAQLLHDDLQQILVSAKLQLNAACGNLPFSPLLKNVEDLLNRSIAKSRSLSHELSPSVLHHSGLLAGLDWLSHQMKEQFGLMIHIEAETVKPLDITALDNFLYRAVQELLFNIVKHAGVKTAQIKLSRANSDLCICVSDQGKGFNPDIIQGTAQNTGFGLLTISERAHHIGGSLKIESSPGCGSRFILTVPLSQRPTDDAQQHPPTAEQQLPLTIRQKKTSPKSGIRVLFADDHKVMRQGVLQFIARQPDIHVVGEASNGYEALEMVRTIRPDVVVMDVSMPGMDGIEATHHIKAELPEVRVIGLSMYDDEQVRQALQQAGAEVLVNKTATSAELLKAIYGIIRPEKEKPLPILSETANSELLS